MMYYYNPETKEVLSYDALSDLLNASIALTDECVGDNWYLIKEDEKPETGKYEKIFNGPIEERAGSYYKTYIVVPMTDDEVADVQAREAEARLNAARHTRAEAVSRITVEVDGMVFDGDETAQDRMSRVAAIASEEELSTQLPWVLADNTVANVTVAQIKEALRKALYAQAALWVVPYVGEVE